MEYYTSKQSQIESNLSHIYLNTKRKINAQQFKVIQVHTKIHFKLK